MKVEELIEELLEMPLDAEVLIENHYDVSLGSGYEGAGPSCVEKVSKRGKDIYLIRDDE